MWCILRTGVTTRRAQHRAGSKFASLSTLDGGTQQKILGQRVWVWHPLLQSSPGATNTENRVLFLTLSQLVCLPRAPSHRSFCHLYLPLLDLSMFAGRDTEPRARSVLRAPFIFCYIFAAHQSAHVYPLFFSDRRLSPTHTISADGPKLPPTMSRLILVYRPAGVFDVGCPPHARTTMVASERCIPRVGSHSAGEHV